MTEATNDKRDFFVSFNQADRAWATWIAWVLEEAGYSVFFQDWDFRGNFVEHMNRAHVQAHRTLAVLSDHYFGSDFTLSEWSARFAEDPAARDDRLVPVKVGPLTGETILRPIVHADLTGCDPDEAERRLLERVRKAVDATYRAKPDKRPSFPGGAIPRQVRDQPRFPIATNNLPPHNPDFVGRERVLAELRRLLLAGQGPAVLTQAITGLGGIGKSQTARAYAYRHLADYDLVWWLRAETPATLAADYATLAGPLGLDPGTADQTQLTAAIKQRLLAMPGWLLMFDNVEDPALPQAWLPGTGGGHALITSRRTDWRGIAKALSLELMPEDEALQLLTGRRDPQTLPPPELAAARDLAAELGRLPLALAQARAYMAETGKGLAGYLRLFRSSRPADFAADAPSADYPASYATTWRISIDAAAATCPAARPLLELLAFLAPDPLPIEVLGADPAALPEDLRSEHARDDAIAALRRYSLIAAEAEELTVHRLVQAVARDGIDEVSRRSCTEAALWLMYGALPRPPSEHTNWPVYATLLPHALDAAAWAEQLGAGLEAAAAMLHEFSLYYRVRAAWGEAEHLCLRAIAIGETAFGLEHPNLATQLNNLANLYRATGRYAEAEPLFQRAIAISENSASPDYPDLATGLNSLANLCQAAGRYAEAEPLYRRAIAVGEKALGPDHPDLAVRLNNLASLYVATARYAEAQPLLQRAIAIGERAYGLEHPNLTVPLNTLAALCRTTGRYAEAEPLYQRAIAIGEKTVGPDHPDLATGLNNLAELYRIIGRYGEAEPLFQRAIAIGEKILGPDHPDLATRLNNLADLYRATGRYAKAEPLVHRAIAIGEKILGPDHPNHATRLNSLANLYQDTGRYAEAEPLFQRAIAIDEKILGLDHPDLATRLNNLAGLYQATGRYAKAEPLFQRAIAIFEASLPPDHRDLAFCFNNLAGLYQATGRYAEAEPLLQRTIAIGEKILGPDHPELSSARNNLGLSYLHTGRYAEAEPLFQRAIAISEKILGPDHPNLATGLNNLALLYRHTGRYNEAEPLYERAIAIGEKTLGPDHPNLASPLNNLASLCLAAGRYAEAEPLYRRTVAISGKSFGPDHPNLATRLNNLASLYQATGRYAEALPLVQRAVAILEANLPPDHPSLARAHANHTGLLALLGRAGDASQPPY